MSLFHVEPAEWREETLADDWSARREKLEGERAGVAEVRREDEGDRSRRAAPERPIGTPKAGPYMRVRGGARSFDRKPSRTMCER